MSILNFKAHTTRRLYAEFVVTEQLADAINSRFSESLIQQPRGMLLAKSRGPRYAFSIHFPDRFEPGVMFAASYVQHLCPDLWPEERVSLFPAPKQPDNATFEEVSFEDFVNNLRTNVFRCSERCEWNAFFDALIESQSEYANTAALPQEGGSDE